MRVLTLATYSTLVSCNSCIWIELFSCLSTKFPQMRFFLYFSHWTNNLQQFFHSVQRNLVVNGYITQYTGLVLHFISSLNVKRSATILAGTSFLLFITCHHDTAMQNAKLMQSLQSSLSDAGFVLKWLRQLSCNWCLRTLVFWCQKSQWNCSGSPPNAALNTSGVAIIGDFRPISCYIHHHTTTVSRPFFRDHLGELMPEENFWTLWCKERLTEADTPTIRLRATPSGPIRDPPSLFSIFFYTRCPSCRNCFNLQLSQFILAWDRHQICW